MVNNDWQILGTEKGDKVYAELKRAIKDFKMSDLIKNGVLLGLSGGADSVLLLLLMIELRKEHEFPLLAVHINHMIRGSEADRDEAFSKQLCKSLNVDYISVHIDVPMIANKRSIGIEEAARIARYSAFADIISSRNNISTIAVAHNATDNLETVIFNILRGAGTRGASGIAPVRDNIIRPLIYVPKDDITSLLDDLKIEYVTDSTNLLVDYTRNYIRNNILPHMKYLAPSPENSATRLSKNLRSDDDYISGVAEDFINSHSEVRNSALADLHIAVFSRVLRRMCAGICASLEEVHIKKVYELLCSDNFKVSLPGDAVFLCERGACRVIKACKEEMSIFQKLVLGVNTLDDCDADILIGDGKFDNSFLNVYKISIQANLSSAIIKGGLFVRSKQDGDTIFYGGHKKKLKKIFNDLKIPVSLRSSIAVVCDDNGVVWVPGVAVRDDSPTTDERKDLYIAIGIGKSSDFSEHRIRSASEFRI